MMDEVTGAAAAELKVESTLQFAPGDLVYRNGLLVYEGQRVAVLAVPESAEVTIVKGGAYHGDSTDH
jgi:hypothetical protein